MYLINKQLRIKHAIKNIGLSPNTILSYSRKKHDCQSGIALDLIERRKLNLEANKTPKLNEHQQMLIDLEKEAERNLKLSNFS